MLVVGAGQSGCQIADELIRAGRTVFLSVGRCPWFPRRYRGRDILHWFSLLGVLDETVDSLPSPQARLACNPPVSGNDGGHDCHPRWLAERGVRLLGRIVSVEGARVVLQPGLEENLVFGDSFAGELTSAIDAFIADEGLIAPEAERSGVSPAPVEELSELDLEHEGITSILWASGFRPDYSWVDLPLADRDGWPVQERGVTSHPGLYIVGLNWLHKRKSALLCGVGEDAERVVDHLVQRRSTS